MPTSPDFDHDPSDATADAGATSDADATLDADATSDAEATSDAGATLDAVRREVVLDASPERVWVALADGDGLSGWLADEVDLEVREGATGTVRDGDGPRREVAVEEVVPGRRLGLAWRDVEDRESVVDLALEPLTDGRTRVVVVEVPSATLRLVAPAAERLLAAGHPGGGASACGPGPAAAWSIGGLGPVSIGSFGPMSIAAPGVGRRGVGGPSVAQRVLAGAR